jgi:parallel beta-helix repeat protein
MAGRYGGQSSPRNVRERPPTSAKNAPPIRRALLLRIGIRSLSAMLCVVGLGGRAFADAPGRPADKAACVAITRYGARSDGADATRVIQRAIDAAKTVAARCVYVPAGTFGISKIIVRSGVKIIGDGDASVLYAPDPANRQVKLTGAGTGLYSLKIYTVGKRRTDDDEGVWIEEDATEFVIDDVTIDGGNGPGIITYGGSWGRITNNRVYNTRSDAIHMSGGAHHVYIAGNTVRNSGDDMIAVVTYAYHPINTYEILIENNDVADQPWGRGIAVVGGENVTIRDNRISRSSDAGIYIAAESSWATRGVNNVVVRGNRIDECPHAHAEHGQASILVYSDNKFRIENVLLDGNAITDTPTEAIRVEPRHTSNIVCRGNSEDGEDMAPENCGGDAALVSGATVTGALLGGEPVPLPAH